MKSLWYIYQCCKLNYFIAAWVPVCVGQHPLHIAVVNQDLELVKTLVEKGATINDARCTGEFFDPSSKHCQVPELHDVIHAGSSCCFPCSAGIG